MICRWSNVTRGTASAEPDTRPRLRWVVWGSRWEARCKEMILELPIPYEMVSIDG